MAARFPSTGRTKRGGIGRSEDGYAARVLSVELLPAPSAGRLLRPDVVDPLAVVAVAALGVWYFRAIERIGGAWPRRRTVAFGAGLAALLYGTAAGLSRYESALFGAHVAQHLLIGMVAPVLLALGRPVALLLRATTPGRRRRLVRALGTQPGRMLGHPAVAMGVLLGSLFVLYCSSLYELSTRNALVHVLVHGHLVIAGTWVAITVLGLEHVRGPGPGIRLLVVVVAMPFHAFLALAVAGPAGDVPRALVRGVTVAQDRAVGSALLLVGGGVVTFVMAAIVAWEWTKAEARAGAREDRALAHVAAE